MTVNGCRRLNALAERNDALRCAEGDRLNDIVTALRRIRYDAKPNGS